MSQESQPIQTKDLKYADLHMLNSSGNALVEVITETLALNAESGQWTRKSVETGARVMVNDGVRVNPETLLIVAEDDPAGVPMLSHFKERFGAEWLKIGAFIETMLKVNGYM